MVACWLALALACAFGLVAVHRGLLREAPGSLMATGMALMSFGMGGVGPTVVSGPWWAAGFAAVTVWPLVRASRCGRGACRIPHVLGGVAMIYMCAVPSLPMTGGAAADASAPSGHAMADMDPVDLAATPITVPGPLGGAAAAFGWALACYFLLATITALTRRTADGKPTARKLSALDQAAMGFGTVVMLAAVA